MKRSAAIRISIILFAFLMTMVLLEIAVRVIPLYPAAFAMGDTTLGWRYQPNASGIWFSAGCPREYTNFVQLNDRGEHDVDHVLEKPDGTKRVLILGDSLVASFEVPLESIFFRHVESKLDAENADPVEVIATGVAGYGTAQEWLSYQTEGRDYNPDVVLLVFTPHNDFSDNHPAFMALSIDWYYTRPYFHLDDAAQLVEDPPRDAPMPPLHRFLLEHSALYRLLSLKYRQYQPPVSLIGTEYEEARAQSWQVTFAELAALRDSVQADGARFGVIIDPGFLMSRDEQHAFRSEFENGLDERGIPYLSLLDSFSAAEDSGVTVRYACDSHWTPEGHTIAAEQITPFAESLLTP